MWKLVPVVFGTEHETTDNNERIKKRLPVIGDAAFCVRHKLLADLRLGGEGKLFQ
jgi:hypothetical protein